MAEQKLLGQSCAIQITYGGQQAAGTPDWEDTPVSVKCRLKSAKIDNQAVTTDVSTLCDLIEQVVVKRKKATVELEMFIPLSGAIGIDADGTPRIGEYTRVQIKNLSSLTAWRTWEGVMTGQSEEFPDGEQVERITVMVGASGINYGSGYAGVAGG